MALFGSTSKGRYRTALLCVGAAIFITADFCLHAASPRWHEEKSCRWQEVTVANAGKIGFTLLGPAETGVIFTNHLREADAANNRILENGSGVALGDYDGDGLCDIYLCRLQGPNVLFRNLGHWKFEEVTQSAGVACEGQISTAAVFADIDGDGKLDLLVNSLGGGTRSFRNTGDGRFTEITKTRLARQFGATSMALADIDGDGDLDLYVTNYRTTTFKDRPPGLNVEAKMVDGKVVVTPADRFISLGLKPGGVDLLEKGDRDFLYINDGAGGFAPVSWTQGSFLDEDGTPLKAPPTDWGLAVMFRDINGDHLPDIYVCNDFYHWPDRVWINEGGRRFRAIARTALRNMSLSSMAIDFADINRDGYDDFFVAEMLSRHHEARLRQRENVLKKEMNVPLLDVGFRAPVPRNTLCLNRGDGTFAEIAQLSGMDATDWSWGGIFLDVDLDGYEDLLVATGNSHDVQDRDTLLGLAPLRQVESAENRLSNWRRFPRLESPRLAFRNQHDLTFTEVGALWGFNQAGIAHGMALADLDNDGDLDVVINDLNSNASLYRNDAAAPRVQVRLNGAGANRYGIGARIHLYGGAVPMQSQEMIAGGRYLSGDQPIRTFAAGSNAMMRIVVSWREGKETIVENVKPNRIYEIDEKSAQPSSPEKPKAPARLFTDVSSLLNHVHENPADDDFLRQPLLSRTTGRSGPGLAWCDMDGDAFEDLLVGGTRLTVLYNKGGEKFSASSLPGTTNAAPHDIGALVARPGAKGGMEVFTSNSSHAGSPEKPSQLIEFSRAGETQLRPIDEARVGPLALGDIDGDGDLDLFVGGRAIPGRYPVAASSHLYRWMGQAFQLDTNNETVLRSIGLVSGAVFSDIDGDGDLDLILACEWGPVRVFRNEGGRFREATIELGLGNFTGWWNGVTTVDVDGDGRLDIVASNWGRNTKYQSYLKQPLHIYHGDFDGNGTWDLLEAYSDPELRKVVPFRALDSVQEAIPSMVERFPTFRAFGQASVAEILGSHATTAQHLQCSTLDSAIFLNRGDHFEHQALPSEAQFSPAFAVASADFDGDGNEDLFLSQNFFGVALDTSRYDAGRGLCLKGDGHGQFTSLTKLESGIEIYGEQRAAAICDYDHDGRPDLAVTQTGAATRLFHNTGGSPGLRVRLRGSPGNPAGVGAALRLIRADGSQGPIREIHAGSGYWSQDSTTQILGTSKPANKIWVRWPGGKVTTHDLPAAAREIEIAADGKLSVMRP